MKTVTTSLLVAFRQPWRGKTS